MKFKEKKNEKFWIKTLLKKLQHFTIFNELPKFSQGSVGYHVKDFNLSPCPIKNN